MLSPKRISKHPLLRQWMLPRELVGCRSVDLRRTSHTCIHRKYPMLSNPVQQKINEQINNELFSSYSYLAMSAYCSYKQFEGSAQWLKIQSQEEYSHAMRLYDFLVVRGCHVHLTAIEKPTNDFESILDVFENVLKQEQTVTAQIDSLFELAFQEKAFAALVELEWFVKEQVEEEKNARDVLHKFRLLKDDPASLLDLDRELGARTPEEEDG